MKKNVKNIILVVSILLIFITGFAFVSKIYKDSAAKKDYYEIVEMVKNNEISEFSLNLYNGELSYKLRSEGKDGKIHRYTVASATLFIEDVRSFLEENNKENDVNSDKFIKYDYEAGGETYWLMSMLPSILLLAVIIGF